MHRSECRHARNQNVNQVQLKNLEKSVNTANNTSLFFVENMKKQHRDFRMWVMTPIYEQHRIQEKILKDSMVQAAFRQT